MECFWTLESFESRAPTSPQRILPDGRTELIFNLADPFRRYHPDGAIEVQPRTLIVGQMRRFVMVQPLGRVKLFGVRFRPAGAGPFLGAPLDAFTGPIVSLEQAWNRAGRELSERIESARSTADRWRWVENELIERLARHRSVDPLIDRAVELIVRRTGIVSMERLHQELGTSGRQLQRRFRTHVGISPKRLCRILRFQGVFTAIGRRRTAGWGLVAADCGYHDQAHLIHEFKEFAGQSPAAYLRERHEVSDHFTGARDLSDSYKTDESGGAI